MRIGELAEVVGTRPATVRFYEARGLLPDARRLPNGYRDYTPHDATRLSILLGLRQVGVDLEQAARLATMCSAGRCGDVAAALAPLLAEQRATIRHRQAQLSRLDAHLDHLQRHLAAGDPPRPLITLRKEERDV